MPDIPIVYWIPIGLAVLYVLLDLEGRIRERIARRRYEHDVARDIADEVNKHGSASVVRRRGGN